VPIWLQWRLFHHGQICLILWLCFLHLLARRFYYLLHSYKYLTSVTHWFASTPRGHQVCPSFWYYLLRWVFSDFMNLLTWSLKSQTLNSWWIYSNKLSSWLRSSTMSTRFCSPTLTIVIYLRYGVQDPHCIIPFIFSITWPINFACFVTSILWGGNPFLFHFSTLIIWSFSTFVIVSQCQPLTY